LISAAEELDRGLRSGALGFLHKPVEKEQLTRALGRLKDVAEQRVKSLLVVEDDAERRESILGLLRDTDLETTGASVEDAPAALAARPWDCLVLGSHVMETDGNLLQQLRKRGELRSLPIVLFRNGEMSGRAETQVRKLARALVLKEVRSLERLVDETALFLHRDASRLREEQRALLEKLHSSTDLLADKTVLIVDDDVRNIFAMTSLLERHRMRVVSAENGREALERLQSTPEVAVVLMDIMLPEMDGYETTRAIRRMSEYQSLPILALTAKAMKGDREKCIEAGASDYVAKPVESDHLLSMLRTWLYR
ncbi:MAG TPA: response regulator, partial [Candidatus Polarisedimenticolaceae bacterium]|nr:response regulator [Candidatus Polarisedimenticolaceae bacterium]